MTENSGTAVSEKIESPLADMVVIAKNSQEMAKAQVELFEWFSKKVDKEKDELKVAEQNLSHAVEAKIRASGWKRQVNIAKARVTYYEKAREAIEAGYCIVPDFPIDVFAVRTTKAKPRRSVLRSNWKTRNGSTAEPMSLESGDGRYVSESLKLVDTVEDNDGKSVFLSRVEGFEEVDFPLKAVKPMILAELSRAMKLKIFDEIGVLPARRVNSDPMIIGKVILGHGGGQVVNFLITWWVDTSAL